MHGSWLRVDQPDSMLKPLVGGSTAGEQWQMTARRQSKVNVKHKTKYKVTNWAEYDEALRRRGEVTVWFDEDAADAWNEPPSGRPGGQRRYSDLAIVTSLTLRAVFHLALRQTEGFVSSLICLMALDLKTPDYTTISRRSAALEVPQQISNHTGPVHLVIDSTGLKILGNGEWHAFKHRTSNTRRSWRKLHLGVRSDGFIEASALTGSEEDDASVGVVLIQEIAASVASFRADGAYDTRAVYDALGEAGTQDIDVVIPPRRTASPTPGATGPWGQRSEAIERIAEVGSRQWRKESGAHQQARAENAMFRFKSLIGGRLRSRTFERQKTEARIGVAVLNRMSELGMPKSEAIRA